jgi:hypothetical protein
MNDLRNRMRIFDEVPAPSYWNEIELRASSAPAAASPARSTRPALLLVAALLALVVGGGVLILSGNLELPGSSAPRLAYGLDGDIYLADLDGGNAVRVADGVDPDTNGSLNCGTLFGEGPMWAPDGRHFAYRSWWHECLGEVQVRDAEGRLVASVPGFGWDVGWSPDSTRFATWIEFTETIAIYGIDGERQSLLTVTPECEGSGDHDPEWSPDGTSVLIANSPCEFPIDGSTPLPLPADDPRVHFGWTYSPDGSQVAYVDYERVEDEIVDSSVVIAEAGGTVLQVIQEESGPAPWYHDLIWSPSGDRLLFGVTPVWDDGYPSAATELRQIEVGSGAVTTLAAEPGITPIRFLPDGDRILYSTHDDQFVPIGLWSMEADGSNPQLLVAGTAFGDWQPLPASPSASPAGSAPSVAPSVEPSTEPSAAAGLPVGPHVLHTGLSEPGSVPMTVTIPAPGWYGEPGDGILVKDDNIDPPDGAGMISWAGIEQMYVYGDPCNWATTLPGTPATTVDEAMAALGAQASRDASDPIDITLDGYAGKAITLHTPEDAPYADGEFTGCDEGMFAVFAETTRTDADAVERLNQGPGQIDEIWMVDVDGVLVLIAWTYYAGTPQADVDEERAIVESTTFE